MSRSDIVIIYFTGPVITFEDMIYWFSLENTRLRCFWPRLREILV